MGCEHSPVECFQCRKARLRAEREAASTAASMQEAIARAKAAQEARKEAQRTYRIYGTSNPYDGRELIATVQGRAEAERIAREYRARGWSGIRIFEARREAA